MTVELGGAELPASGSASLLKAEHCGIPVFPRPQCAPTHRVCRRKGADASTSITRSFPLHITGLQRQERVRAITQLPTHPPPQRSWRVALSTTPRHLLWNRLVVEYTVSMGSSCSISVTMISSGPFALSPAVLLPILPGTHTGCFVGKGASGFRKGPIRRHMRSYPAKHCFTGQDTTIWSSMDLPKKSEKRPFSPTHCFVLQFPVEFVDVFGRRSYPKRPKRHFSTRGPNPKALMMRWEKVPTSETPCICQWELCLQILFFSLGLHTHGMTVLALCESVPQTSNTSET